VGNLTIRNAQDAQRLRHCVAYAEQFAVLLEGTVENYLLAEHSTELEKDRALQWLRALKLDLALRDCGLAMNTVIGTGGSNLSGGQRRVLAVVRAIGMQRPVLVLDEPTAGLDAEVEKMVVDAISALRGIVTVVVATHTAALMGVADRVLVLEGGRHAGWVIPQRQEAQPAQAEAA
jgi:ABC-type transport system involved in cytochrome bd biosynthesis fused ATPase/permease subunit